MCPASAKSCQEVEDGERNLRIEGSQEFRDLVTWGLTSRHNRLKIGPSEVAVIVAAWSNSSEKSSFHVDVTYFYVTRTMADSPLEQDWDVVSWVLSGSYDEDRPVRRLPA